MQFSPCYPQPWCCLGHSLALTSNLFGSSENPWFPDPGFSVHLRWWSTKGCLAKRAPAWTPRALISDGYAIILLNNRLGKKLLHWISRYGIEPSENKDSSKITRDMQARNLRMKLTMHHGDVTTLPRALGWITLFPKKRLIFRVYVSSEDGKWSIRYMLLVWFFWSTFGHCHLATRGRN